MSARVLVFIHGILPTEEDLALAEKHRTRCFRNATAHTEGNLEAHSYAVACDPAWIPKGYRLTPEEESPAPKEDPSEDEEEKDSGVPADAPWINSSAKPLAAEGK